MRWEKITNEKLKLAYKTLNEINVELVEIMKKLGTSDRYVYLHKDVQDMQYTLLQELGERTLDEPIEKKVS